MDLYSGPVIDLCQIINFQESQFPLLLNRHLLLQIQQDNASKVFLAHSESSVAGLYHYEKYSGLIAAGTLCVEVEMAGDEGEYEETKPR